MDDARIGRLFRAVRHELGLRQVDVALRAGLPRQVIGDIERGRLDRLTVGAVRQAANVLDVRAALEASWRGGMGDRIVDRSHAAMVEHVGGVLRARNWQIVPEYTFNHFGERGSVDLLGWHPAASVLLLVEVKTALTDLQATLASLGRKLRIVPGLVGEDLGWEPRRVGELLVVLSTTANRSVIARHPIVFESRFRNRAHDVRRWLRQPAGPLAGIWFVAPTALRAPPGGPWRQRVRVARSRSSRLTP